MIVSNSLDKEMDEVDRKRALKLSKWIKKEMIFLAPYEIEKKTDHDIYGTWYFFYNDKDILFVCKTDIDFT